MRVHARGRPVRVCGVHREHRLRLVYSTVDEEALEDGLGMDTIPELGRKMDEMQQLQLN